MTWFRLWLAYYRAKRWFQQKIRAHAKGPRGTEWQYRLELIRAKHERRSGPDEQELADMGRSS